MASWRNDDNLLVKFGTDKAAVTLAGSISTMGGRNRVEFDMDLAVLTTTEAIVADTDTIWVPGGALIERVTVIVTEVSTGSSPNLDLGLIYYTDAGVLTELDYNGLIIAGDDWDGSDVGVRTTYEQGGTEHGALLGTLLATTSDKYYFSASSEQSNLFTAGQLHVIVDYISGQYVDVDG